MNDELQNSRNMTEIMEKAATLASSASPFSGKGTKRRNERNILTFYEKIAVIHYYNETNISRNSLAKMFHCCATQIRRILDKKHELLQQQATMSEADASIIIEEMTRKRRKFEMSAISFILHQWVERCRQLRLQKTITNQTLKETAIKMAAILNLPAFRPSYRWVNRFRSKYKYNAPDLGSFNAVAGSVEGDLAVEDIIIEFKDALPSFMQKEIAAITSSIAKGDGDIKATGEPARKTSELPSQSNTSAVETVGKPIELGEGLHKNEDVGEGLLSKKSTWDADFENPLSLSTTSDDTETSERNGAEPNVGVVGNTCALLDGIFPHLAVIHQFALLNSDVKALELISQLGVHMQTQAFAGAYKELSLATPGSQDTQLQNEGTVVNGSIYADIDDIVLME